MTPARAADLLDVCSTVNENENEAADTHDRRMSSRVRRFVERAGLGFARSR